LFCTAFELLFEVIFLPRIRRVLEPLVVHGEALDQILVQARSGPLAELRAAMATDTVTDRQNHGQAVVLNFAGDLTFALGSNYSIFSNSCCLLQLSVGVNLFQMVVYGVDADLEQFRHQLLRQPDHLVLEAALDPGAAVFGLVEDEAGIWFTHAREERRRA